MSKILLLYPDLPSETKAAGHKSAFQTIKELHKLDYELALYSFASTNIVESDKNILENLCKDIYIENINVKDKIVNCMKNIFLPPLIASRVSKTFINTLDRIIGTYDVIHIEFSQMLYYVKYIKTKYPEKKIIFYSHDVITQKAYRRAKRFYFLNLFKNHDYLLCLMKKIFYSDSLTK